MPDTPRTVAELKTIFADNSSGDITPQDMRDFVESVADPATDGPWPTHGFRVYHLGDGNGNGLVFNSGSSLEFDTALYDTDGYLDMSTPNGDVDAASVKQVVCQRSGIYHLAAFADFDADPNGRRSLGLITSQDPGSIDFMTVPAAAVDVELSLSTLYPVLEGQTISAYIQLSGVVSPLTMWDGTPYGYYLAGHWLGPLPNGFSFP